MAEVAVVRQRRLDPHRRWTSEALASLPARSASPGVELARRSGLALLLLTIVVVLVYRDRDSYNDTSDGELGLIDAIY